MYKLCLAAILMMLNLIACSRASFNDSADAPTTDFLVGYEENEDLDSLDDKEFSEMYASEETIFTYEDLQGTDTDFSEPVMVSGASLLDPNTFCKDRSYQADEPKFRDVVDFTVKSKVCGDVSMNFCLRLSEEGGGTNYIFSPDVNLKVPCGTDDSFKDLNFTISSGKSHTEKNNENISISAQVGVVSVYITNDPTCSTGGAWEAIKSEDPTWDLNWVDGKATVYAKFSDIYNKESNCLSDTIFSGEPQIPDTKFIAQCLLDEVDYKAINIKEGVMIGTIQGTGDSSIPSCTTDGQIGCIASDSFKASEAAGLATKVVLGQTVAGVAGTIVEETHAHCTGAGQENCITTSIYKTMDLASSQGVIAELTASNFGAKLANSASFEYWDRSGKKHTSSGDANLTADKIAYNKEILGVTGTAGAPPDCSSIAGSWVLVPGDPNYGTKDFCVKIGRAHV